MENYERLLDIVKTEEDLEKYLSGKGISSIEDNGDDEVDGNEAQKGPDYQALYNLSRLRQNLLDWYDFEGDGRLLELGAECGALTALFIKKVAQVVSFDPDPDKCEVNRARNAGNVPEGSSLSVVSTIESIENQDNENKKGGRSRKPAKFDYVTIIGDFTDEKLEVGAEYLKSKGQLIVAVDNRFGLKNWTTEERPDIPTKEEIIEKALEKKLKLAATYYPVPDYIFPLEIYSELNPPKEGAIRTAAPEFLKDKTLLMDEPTAFSEMIRSGRFDQYANSYILIFEKKGGRR